MLLEHDWRLIIDEAPRTGAMNMAVDEAILTAHRDGLVPPTLRLYRWGPACVSFGYSQKFEQEVDPEACAELGVDWVRRTTGGRAVLHDEELTYSVVIRTELLPGGVLETYRIISGGLVAAFRELGLHAVLADRHQQPRFEGTSAACFDSPSAYELVVNGKKAVGSAQARKDGVILQHGSIPLTWDVEKLSRVFHTPSERFRERLKAVLLRKATGLSRELGREFSYVELCEAFRHGFEQGLSLHLEEGRLTPGEVELAEELSREKYGTEAWNRRK